MKVAMVINGTKGDVQPMVALSTGLIGRGHEVVICAPPENKELIRRFKCSNIPFGPNYREIFRKKAGEIKGGATMSPTPNMIKKDTFEQIRLLPDLLKDVDLILGVGFVLGVHTVADILKVPYRFVVFYPAMLGPSRKDPAAYRMLFTFGKSMTNVIMKKSINRIRKKAGLPEIKDVWDHWMGDEVIVACDREINPVKEGVEFRHIQTAYMPIPALDILPDEVKDFLEKGTPPVFITFGSNPVAKPEEFHPILEEASLKTGQRLIIAKGWADMPANNTDRILYVDEISYAALFPKTLAIIHHGGMGTMALAARTGKPQAAFPFMADQFENRKQIVKLGIGPDTCDFKKISAEALTEAINASVNELKFRINAGELAASLKDTDGISMTADEVEKLLAVKD